MSKKILVIDDEPEIIQILKTRLNKNGFTVVTANDGMDGLQKVSSEKPDLIIVDVIMPKLDGYSFVRETRQLPDFKTPIIVLTARDQLQDIFKIEGIRDYIIKPFDTDELFKKINQYLGNT